MTEADIKVFLNGTMDYFLRVSQSKPRLDTPYLRSAEEVLFDYTGAICVSGHERGYVMFTARQEMLQDILHGLGDPDLSAESCRDLVGEMANTISGIARRDFGQGFSISVPQVFDAVSNQCHLPETGRTFVIPIYWKQHKSHLLVSTES